MYIAVREKIKKVLAYICLHAASCLTVMCYVKIFHIIPAHSGYRNNNNNNNNNNNRRFY